MACQSEFFLIVLFFSNVLYIKSLSPVSICVYVVHVYSFLRVSICVYVLYTESFEVVSICIHVKVQSTYMFKFNVMCSVFC